MNVSHICQYSQSRKQTRLFIFIIMIHKPFYLRNILVFDKRNVTFQLKGASLKILKTVLYNQITYKKQKEVTQKAICKPYFWYRSFFFHVQYICFILICVDYYYNYNLCNYYYILYAYYFSSEYDIVFHKNY